MALLKDGTRIFGTLYANTEVVIGSMNVASQINAAFLQANSANILAQAAFDKANTTSANTVYTQGVDETQNTQISIIQGVDTTQNARITSADDLAREAFSQANAAYNRANVGATFVNSGGTIAGNVSIQGSLSVSGNVIYTGNVTSVTVSGNTGQFFGYAANGFNALYAGIPTGYLVEPQTVFQMTSNYAGYAGLNMQNINQGNLSSADLFIIADNGTVLDTFLDLGLASSTYSYPGYGLIKPNDGYWIVYGNTITGGGNAIIATGTTNDIVFATNGIEDANVVMRITASNTVVVKSTVSTSSKTTGALQVAGGIGVQGDIQATNIYSQGTNLLSYTQAAFDKANTGITSSTDQYARDVANTASSNTIYTQGVDVTQNTNITNVNTFASSAYDKANTADVKAQAAFDKANTGVTSSTDQYARDTANSAAANTIYTQGVDVTQNTNITNINSFASSAYDKANSANVLAQAAFDKANTSSSTPGGSDTQVQFNDGGSTFGGDSTFAFNKTSKILSVQQVSVTNSSGDEGGEILLAKPVTNTTLDGTGVTVDVYQNKLRFFEQGGSARGFYLDISTGGGGAGTNIMSGGGGGSTNIDQYARDTANTASSNTVYIQGVNETQNTNITLIDTKSSNAYDKANSANVLAQAAFDKANTGSTDINSFNPFLLAGM